jgi:CheY-like chemotaxis protein
MVFNPSADETSEVGSPGVYPGAARTCEETMPTAQVTDGRLDVSLLLATLKAYKKGDFSARMPLDWTGTVGKVADTVNDIVESSQRMSKELARLSRVVGREGKMGQRASMGDVTGEWAEDIHSINALLDDLASPAIETARVIGAVAGGDLSQTMSLERDGAPLQGSFLQTAQTINTMVDTLATIADQVTTVAREVGNDGKLGGQAVVKGVSGTWKDLTDKVNFMAANLTSQVRSIATVTTAVANGDLSKKITVNAQGEILELKNTINTMVDTLATIADQVTTVAREVGNDGKLGGQAEVKGVSGTWKDLTDVVNFMAANLTSQVRNIATVTTALANGDLSKKITVNAQGEILELKNTINTMVDTLAMIADQVTTVAREVGNDGKLGGQAEVKGVSGTWKDLTDVVNFMAANLTSQVRGIAKVVTAVANGDLSKKITVNAQGEILELKNTINTMVDTLATFADQVTTVAREVGNDGKLGGQAEVKGVFGTWKDLTDVVNFMAANLTSQVRNIATVTTALANGDLSKKITVNAQGEILELKNTFNTMVDTLATFADQVTTVAREVGNDGKLGGQAEVKGVFGTWKDLTDVVNFMAANLTSQVRGIAKAVTAVANGDLSKKITVNAQGEIAALTDTLNSMIDTLATFADQVTTVAREVGVEGKLGGQAVVKGVSGTWKDLTDNVNFMAANLTTQVRAIAEVSTAVTKGDLTRSIQVEASGELAALKDNINKMIGNLRDTTRKNTEQDWLQTNLAKFTRMLQGQRDVMTVSKLILSELAPLVAAQHGVLYMMETGKDQGAQSRLKLVATYAYKECKNLSTEFRLGEGLVGQCALEKQRILLSNAPPDYVQISSGLGQAAPLNIVLLPVLFEGQVRAVIELASFERFSAIHQVFLDQLTDSIGVMFNTIQANARTEELLNKSQTMGQELQSQQEELRQTNEELEEKARLLSDQKAEVERKNREVEVARQALEEKATQLALTSKYKSEFLSNMSHELRTPLNSLMMLSQQLSENSDGNLTALQVRFAQTISGSGGDLLTLMNDILDLSKIESGTVTLEVSDVAFREVEDQIERTFRHVAEGKGLSFEIELARDLPQSISTDAGRLQQVLKNLLSNAFKFTEKGGVKLRIAPATEGWSVDHTGLNQAQRVLTFAASDTGVGIPLDKQRLIFEAFQQADGTTSRKYGGTGLGLSISREIATLLGGEIRLVSAPGKGSTFTLYLPQGLTPGQSKPGRNFARARETQPARRGRNSSSSLPAVAAVAVLEPDASEVPDDRDELQPGDRVLLMVEDDAGFASILLDRAHQKGFKGVVARRGDDALTMARQYQPDAITLDLHLPDMDGWLVLDRLKHMPETRHIPVHIISIDAGLERGLRAGAIAHLAKPVTKETLDAALSSIKSRVERREKFLLVVEPQEAARQAVLDLIGSENVRATAVGSGAEALAALEEKPFDCMVLGLELPDMSGLQLLDEIRRRPALRTLPVVVYSDKGLTEDQEAQLARAAKTAVVKDARSPERLLEEATLFLHQANLPDAKRQMLERLHTTDPSLAGRKVLVVDDDVRNIFAITSLLEHQGVEVVSAESGKQAIEVLQSTPGIDGVLMDVMMPEMDGHQTMKAIRQIPRFRALPMIAVTAKAMKGDREKCLEAGASEYISKPVDTERLLSLLRVWLYRSEDSPE